MNDNPFARIDARFNPFGLRSQGDLAKKEETSSKNPDKKPENLYLFGKPGKKAAKFMSNHLIMEMILKAADKFKKQSFY